MLADADTYDEIKQVALDFLQEQRCTECGTAQFIWVWHFLCVSCGRKLGYDQWIPDKEAAVIVRLLRGPLEHELCAETLEAWFACHPPHEKATLSRMWDWANSQRIDKLWEDAFPEMLA